MMTGGPGGVAPRFIPQMDRELQRACSTKDLAKVEAWKVFGDVISDDTYFYKEDTKEIIPLVVSTPCPS